MDIIIRDVEEINGQYKIYNKDGTGGHWYISKESAEQLSNQVERVVSLASDPKEAVQTAERENYKKVYEKYGADYLIKKVNGTKVDVTKLKNNQSVCFGDGKTYHYLLTKIEQ